MENQLLAKMTEKLKITGIYSVASVMPEYPTEIGKIVVENWVYLLGE